MEGVFHPLYMDPSAYPKKNPGVLFSKREPFTAMMRHIPRWMQQESVPLRSSRIISAIMKQFVLIVIVMSSCPSVFGQQPLPQTEACKRFSAAVVPIDTDRPMHGTGFIVSSDGWIVTAAHVVTDLPTGKGDSVVTVTLPGNHPVPAHIVPNPDRISQAEDFALLKVDASNLPSLEIEESSEVVAGQSLAVIGFPFSAFGAGRNKFCLSVLAATDPIPTHSRVGDVIYFQGPSIKGLSGSPLISLNSGKVVGILDLKLTGITEELDKSRAKLAVLGEVFTVSSPNIGSPFGFASTTREIIDTLDNQLANGLGAAIEATDAAYALKKAKKQQSRKK